MSDKLKEQNLEVSSNDDSSDLTEESLNLRKKKNGFRRNSPQFESSPVKSINKEKQFNCKECFFQGTKQIELNKRMNLKHSNGETSENVIKCRTCGESFSAKWNLMNHRQSKDLETVAQCRNYIERNCTYSQNICWWNHGKKHNESIKCCICEEVFESKMLLMMHRKKEHNKFVKTCNQFNQNGCRFQNSDCWYKHAAENEKDNDDETNSKYWKR